jgi:hypothetical protein
MNRKVSSESVVKISAVEPSIEAIIMLPHLNPLPRRGEKIFCKCLFMKVGEIYRKTSGLPRFARKDGESD